MLAKTGLNNILKRLMANGEITEELQNDITTLQADFDESREVLKKFGTVDENEETENYEYLENEIIPVDNGFEEKYNTLHQQYIDRFFGGGEPTPDPEPTPEPEPEPNEDITINDLFK